MKIFRMTLILIFVTLGCKKTPYSEYIRPIVNEYFDANNDEYTFFVVKDIFSAVKIDVEVWTKILDKQTTKTTRLISFQVNSSIGTITRAFNLSFGSILTSSEDATNFLYVYQDFNIDDSTRTYYSSSIGRYKRYYYYKLTDVQTPYYKGKAIFTELQYKVDLTDSTEKNVFIDEYYAKDVGLVLVKQQINYIKRNIVDSSNTVYKNRVL